MSAGVQNGGEDSGEFDLNITPIIDCFTLLITYMLVSASFISLNALEVHTSATSDQAEAEQPSEPQLYLTAILKETHALEFKVSGKEEAVFNIPSTKEGDWNLKDAQSQIMAIVGKWPSIQDISVKAEAGVKYKGVVKVVEGLKKAMPKVFLGE